MLVTKMDRLQRSMEVSRVQHLRNKYSVLKLMLKRLLLIEGNQNSQVVQTREKAGKEITKECH